MVTGLKDVSRLRVGDTLTSIARPAAIYGPDNNIYDMETAMFLRLRRKLPVLLPHGGLVTGNYGHVDDLCALLRALQPAAGATASKKAAATCASMGAARRF